jgi:hypothetical protein
MRVMDFSANTICKLVAYEPAFRKKERNPIQRGHVEGIGSIVGMQPYNGKGGGSLGGECKQLCPGACGF